jgi:hypothetical protein
LAEELDRVGVTYRKAGAADYVWALDLGEFVDLLGPPRLSRDRTGAEVPRRPLRSFRGCRTTPGQTSSVTRLASRRSVRRTHYVGGMLTVGSFGADVASGLLGGLASSLVALYVAYRFVDARLHLKERQEDEARREAARAEMRTASLTAVHNEL